MRSILFTLIAACIFSCGHKKYMTESGKRVAPDFKNYQGVLLVMDNCYPGGLNCALPAYYKDIRKNFMKHYKGRCLFISQLNLSQYPDVDSFRYTINVWTYPTGPSTLIGRGGLSASFEMIDRKTDLRYYSFRKGLAYSASHYPQLLENIRSGR